MACSDRPKIVYVTSAFLFIGFLCSLIGFATPHWIILGDQYFGLWQFCGPEKCVSTLSVIDGYRYLTTNLTKVLALGCIGLVFAAGSVVAVLAFIRIIPIMKSRPKTLANLTATGCLLSSICNGITMYLFGISFPSAGYSSILFLIGTGFLALAAILAFVMSCNLKPDNPVVYYNAQGTPQYPQGTPQYPQGTPQYPQGTPQYPQETPQYPQGTPHVPTRHRDTADRDAVQP